MKLDSLSDEDLTAVITAAHALLEERRKTKRAEFVATVRREAQELGLDVQQVAAALGRSKGKGKASGGDKRSTVQPKYRNPGNPKETWSGRGVKPKWMNTLIAKGAKPEDFLIESAI